MKIVRKKVLLVVLAAILALGSAVIFLNREILQKFVNGDTAEDIIEFELADFKNGDEYQLGSISWGISLEELKSILSSSYTLKEFTKSDAYIYYLSSKRFLLEGKSAVATYKFLNDKLVEIQLGFDTKESAVKQFKPFVEELTALFGPESEMSENELVTGDICYTWETDNTMLQIIDLSAVRPNMTIFIRSTNY